MTHPSRSETGLPTYKHHDPNAIEQDYAEIEGIEGEVRLRKGAMASFISNNRVYGEKSLESFAGKMSIGYTNLHNYKQMYERIQGLEISNQLEIVQALRAGKLTTTHVLVAAPIESDRKFGAVLARAHDGPPQRLWPENENGERIPISGLTVSETASAAKRVLKQSAPAHVEGWPGRNRGSESHANTGGGHYVNLVQLRFGAAAGSETPRPESGAYCFYLNTRRILLRTARRVCLLPIAFGSRLAGRAAPMILSSLNSALMAAPFLSVSIEEAGALIFTSGAPARKWRAQFLALRRELPQGVGAPRRLGLAHHLDLLHKPRLAAPVGNALAIVQRAERVQQQGLRSIGALRLVRCQAIHGIPHALGDLQISPLDSLVVIPVVVGVAGVALSQGLEVATYGVRQGGHVRVEKPLDEVASLDVRSEDRTLANLGTVSLAEVEAVHDFFRQLPALPAGVGVVDKTGKLLCTLLVSHLPRYRPVSHSLSSVVRFVTASGEGRWGGSDWWHRPSPTEP